MLGQCGEAQPGWLSAKVLFLLPHSSLHIYTGFQTLLVNLCATYFALDCMTSPLQMLTYLSFTSLG